MTNRRMGFHHHPAKGDTVFRRAGRVALLGGGLLLGWAGSAGAEVLFERDVRPILRAHCFHCHGEEEGPEAGVDLRLRRFMERELDGGRRVVVPGLPDASELVRLIREGEMPKKGAKVPAAEVAVIERWILEGARTAKPEPESLAPGPIIGDEDREFWSFKPVTKPAVPSTAEADRVRTPVDAFVAEKLRAAGLAFAPDADKVSLLRRVTIDLTGLPPTIGELDEFLADGRPDAYERVVDRLLATTAYGERWARHWLDAAGYADSNGFAEADSPRPHAWRFRDYVIRSIAADKPWDEFIVEQLAGDELAAVTHGATEEAVQDETRRDRLIATGFLRLAPDGTGDAVDDARLARNQVIAEEIKVVTSSLLGLTVGCAQCHDHRYDPITHADYHRLRAVFEPAYDWQRWRTPAQRLVSLYTPAEHAQAAAIEKAAQAIDAEAQAMSRGFLDQIFEKEILKLPEPDREPYRRARAKPENERSAEEKALIKRFPSALALYSLDLYDPALQKKVTEKAAGATKLRGTKPAEGMIMALTEVKGEVPETRVFRRGDHDQPKQAVGPGEISVLAGPEIEPFRPAATAGGSTGRRLAYARWLTSGRHPLVARVLVNRFWLHHFGRGLVNTPGDFGSQGERPTHPELLDWLAADFVEGGWKLKRLHRLIVTSRVYRQSSRNDASVREDPDNRLLGRHRVQRLSGEALRDSMLAAAGRLNATPFGPPVSIARDPQGRTVVGRERHDVNGDVTGVDSIGENDFRRSIYVQVRRRLPLTVLEAFDAPVMTPNCEARASTTVAPQSLLLMNDTFVLDTARALAQRVRAERPGDARAQIAHAWRLVFSRDPDPDSIPRMLAYLGEQTETIRVFHEHAERPKDAAPPDPALDALASLCQVLFSSNRFLYVE